MPSKKVIAECQAKNICTDCRKNSPGPRSKYRCDDCQNDAKRSSKNLYDYRAENNLCTKCGEPVVQNTKYCLKHLLNNRKIDKKKRNKIKDLVFKAYGGYRCNCCGETECSFLAIDHVNNDGAKHRKQIGLKSGSGGFYRWLRDNKFPSGFQVLCFNCNHSKAVNGGVCIHEIRRLEYKQNPVKGFSKKLNRLLRNPNDKHYISRCI